MAAVGGIPFTGGASAIIPAVGAAGAVGNAAVPGNEVLNEDGGSVQQVVVSMEEAIESLTREIK